MARRIAAVILSLGCLHASAVSALGLGELTLDSFLNEPFKAKVDLLNMEGLSEHQIRIRLATSDDFDRLGVDRAYFLTSLTFEITMDDEGNGQIILRSEEPVLEPYLDFILEARWPSGRLLREYTVLVDPPVFQSEQSISISASTVVGQADTDASAKKKPQVSSGTQVNLDKSNLAEGEMPQRNFGSDASPSAVAGERYLIRRDETLWKIAQRSKPEGTSVHQAMLDIQRLNPNAFIGGNINRMKAGYVIYLPSSSDISSDDLGSAMAEVRQQNQDWREGVTRSQSDTTGGSLRISTEPQTADTAGQAAGDSVSESGSGSDMASMEGLERAERDRAEVEVRLESMADQVETLERIVSLKDDQIAALQKALADAGESAEVQTLEEEAVDLQSLESATIEQVEDSVAETDIADAQVEEIPAAEPAAEVAVSEVPAEKPVVTAKKKEEGGFFGTIMYILGGLVVLAVAVWAFLRRRGEEAEEAPAKDDVFANVQLNTDEHKVVAEPESEVVPEPEPEPEPEPVEKEQTTTTEAAAPTRRSGYGERKHDEYASDTDSGDALAEADIYIAYGRYPQAVDLLKTAIENEPANPDYKLKLMQVSSETGDQAEVMKQFAEIKRLGDAESVQSGEEIINGINDPADAPVPQSLSDPSTAADPLDLSDDLDLDLPALDIEGVGGDVDLEEEFGSLEIEGFDGDAPEDDLDLSIDFSEDSSATTAGTDEEEMVFATESDAMSTKLDLARAYLDMGDQDGARAIFEEVLAEGSDEQKDEARVLLERLD
jgi:pilus assembly protein FimV